jgi:hypothetical protein
MFSLLYISSVRLGRLAALCSRSLLQYTYKEPCSIFCAKFPRSDKRAKHFRDKFSWGIKNAEFHIRLGSFKKLEPKNTKSYKPKTLSVIIKG